MKIVQASKAYWPHLGGIETIVKQLAEGFAADGIESSVIAAGNPPGKLRANGVDLTRTRSFASVRSVPVSPWYPVELLRVNGDVLLVHEPSVLPEIVLALADGQLRKRFNKLALWWHSDVVRQRFLKLAFEPALLRALKNVDVILTATPNHISSSPTLSTVRDKVRVVPFGVKLNRFELTDEVRQLATRFEAQFGPNIVLFVGRLVYYKGIGELVGAMENVPNAHLVVVGNGPERESIETSALAKAGRLTILPPVEEHELVALMHACKIFVLPSTEVSEAFGIVQVEAMACGRPVITFDLPTGVTWVNLHNRTGLVVPLGNTPALAEAIRDLLSDPIRREHLGANARKRVESEMTEALMIRRVIDALS